MTAKRKHQILIITENFTFGGLETHIQGEINELKQAGWDVHLVCGEQFKPDLVPASVDSVNHGLKMGPLANGSDLISTVSRLGDIIKDKNIDIIHAHPFLSLFPSYIAASINRVPIVVTLHGIASVSPGISSYYDFINSLILRDTNVVVVSQEVSNSVNKVCGSVELCIIPNAVEVEGNSSVSNKPSLAKSRWMIASRLDEDKTVGIKRFLSLAQTVAIGSVDIYGDGPEKDQLKRWLQEMDMKNVNILGYEQNIPRIMKEYDGVAGMGRVTLESLAAGRIACLVGYDGVKGIVATPDFLEKAAHSNFSGRNLKNISAEELRQQYKSLSPAKTEELIEVVRTTYEQGRVWKKFRDYSTKATIGDSEFVARLYSAISENAKHINSPWTSSPEMWRIAGSVARSGMDRATQTLRDFDRYHSKYLHSLSEIPPASSGARLHARGYDLMKRVYRKSLRYTKHMTRIFRGKI